MKLVMKFVMATKKLTNTSESETKRSVEEQKREIEGCVNRDTQKY